MPYLYGAPEDPSPEETIDELVKACRVALEALRGEVSPSVAEHALEEAIRKATGDE